MENINNIRFGINEDFVEFWYFQNNEEKTAYLQLPDTPDSIHQINNINSDEWGLKEDENGQCEEREIFSILLKHYSESFKKERSTAYNYIYLEVSSWTYIFLKNLKNNSCCHK